MNYCNNARQKFVTSCGQKPEFGVLWPDGKVGVSRQKHNLEMTLFSVCSLYCMLALRGNY